MQMTLVSIFQVGLPFQRHEFPSSAEGILEIPDMYCFGLAFVRLGLKLIVNLEA